MNISKSFIKDVVQAMEKYGFSAGGGGGDDTIKVYTSNMQVTECTITFEKLVELKNSGKMSTIVLFDTSEDEWGVNSYVRVAEKIEFIKSENKFDVEFPNAYFLSIFYDGTFDYWNAD